MGFRERLSQDRNEYIHPINYCPLSIYGKSQSSISRDRDKEASETPQSVRLKYQKIRLGHNGAVEEKVLKLIYNIYIRLLSFLLT